jgi:hypothetical protein
VIPKTHKNPAQRIASKDLTPPTHEWRIDFNDLKPPTHEWRIDFNEYAPIMTISAYGFVIVIVSLLFLYIGYLLDEWLGTAPNFMFGLFFLAIVTSIGRLYHEAWLKSKNG